MSPLRGADSGDVDVAGEALRARGLRMTPQRARVMESVRRLAHATPEEIAEHVSADGGPPLSLSTVYRALEALEGVGAVSHGHLQHRAPTYHLASHADHLHLRCTRCGAVDEAEMATAAGLACALAAARGFVADVRHLVIPGRCAACATDEHDEADEHDEHDEHDEQTAGPARPAADSPPGAPTDVPGPTDSHSFPTNAEVTQ